MDSSNSSNNPNDSVTNIHKKKKDKKKRGTPKPSSVNSVITENENKESQGKMEIIDDSDKCRTTDTEELSQKKNRKRKNRGHRKISRHRGINKKNKYRKIFSNNQNSNNTNKPIKKSKDRVEKFKGSVEDFEDTIKKLENMEKSKDTVEKSKDTVEKSKDTVEKTGDIVEKSEDIEKKLTELENNVAEILEKVIDKINKDRLTKGNILLCKIKPTKNTNIPYEESELEFYEKKRILSKEEVDYIKYFQKRKYENQRSHLPVKYKIMLIRNMRSKTKNSILDKIEYLNMGFADESSKKLKKWANNICKIPFDNYVYPPIKSRSSKKNISKFLLNAKKELDNCIYGQEKAKNHILEILGKNITNPKW